MFSYLVDMTVATENDFKTCKYLHVEEFVRNSCFSVCLMNGVMLTSLK